MSEWTDDAPGLVPAGPLEIEGDWLANADPSTFQGLVTTRGFAVWMNGRYTGREITNYMSGGRLDPSRSHYSLNGCKVTYRQYRRAMEGGKK